MQVTFVNQTSVSIPQSYVQRWLRDLERHSLKKYRLQKRELTIVFLGPAAMKKLNAQFRGHDYATDVLSFESGVPSVLGELVLCPQVIKKQAPERRLTFKEELAFLILHGILHLLGFDHEQGGKGAREMFALQDRIFARIDKIR